MKQILKLVFLLVLGQTAFAQAPSNYVNINGRYRWIAGMFDSTFHIPKGTTPSLRTGGSTNGGALFFKTADSSLQVYTGSQWLRMLKVGDTTGMLLPYFNSVGVGLKNTSQTVYADTLLLSTRLWRNKGIDSLQANLTVGLALKLNISDTANMLLPYLRKVDTASLSNRINLKVNISDTASMLNPYARTVNVRAIISDSLGGLARLKALNAGGAGIYSNSGTKVAEWGLGGGANFDFHGFAGYDANRASSYTVRSFTDKNYVDSAISASPSGTVTSVATNNGSGITGGTITTSGTIAADTLLLSTRAWRQKGVDSVASLINTRISGTTNYIPKFTSSSAIGNSQIFDNGTNVGIGTATPSYKLDVFDAAGTSVVVGATGKIFIYGDNAGGTVGTLTSIPLKFSTNNTEKMRLDASGNLGLGVTPSAWARGKALEIGTIGNSIWGDVNNEITTITSNAYLNTSDLTTGWAYGITAASARYDLVAGVHKWFNAPSGTAGNAISFTQAMTLFSTGNLAVGGTSDNGYKLDVSGTGRFTGDLNVLGSSSRKLTIGGTGAGNYGELQLGDGTQNNPYYLTTQVGGNNDGIAIKRGSSSFLSFASTGAATFSSSVTTSGGRVTIQGTNQNSLYLNQNAGGTSTGFLVGRSFGSTDTQDFFIYDIAAASARMFITSGGNVGIGTTSPDIYGNTLSRYLALSTTVSSGYSSFTAAGGAGGGGGIDFGNQTIRHGGIYSIDGSSIAFYTNAANSGNNIAERMRITSGGDVGIGTTSPAAELQVGKASDVTIAMSNSSSVTSGNRGTLAWYNSAVSSVAAIRAAAVTDNVGTELQFFTRPAAGSFTQVFTLGSTGAATFSSSVTATSFNGTTNNIFSVSGTEGMRLTSTGLGIGTTSPEQLLTVAGGNIIASGNTGTNRQVIELTTASTVSIVRASYVGSSTFGDLALWTGGSERMRITSGGELLINTTSDAGDYKLQVNGNSYLNGVTKITKSVELPHTTKSAAYTLTSDDYTVGFNVTSASITATLPDATTCAGRTYVIYQYNTGNGARGVTIDGNGAQTINGIATYSLLGWCDYSSVILQSDGSNWIILSDAIQSGCL
jgi:hypothetical protein